MSPLSLFNFLVCLGLDVMGVLGMRVLLLLLLVMFAVKALMGILFRLFVLVLVESPLTAIMLLVLEALMGALVVSFHALETAMWLWANAKLQAALRRMVWKAM